MTPVPSCIAASRTRVLVVDSNRPFREVLSRAVQQDDRFDVVGTAETGDEAVSFAAPFELALVDLGIRGLGSLLTVARLRERTPPPTVVVLSPTDAIYLRHAAGAEGAAGLLVIPDDLDHLGERLGLLLAHSLDPRLGTEQTI